MVVRRVSYSTSQIFVAVPELKHVYCTICHRVSQYVMTFITWFLLVFLIFITYIYLFAVSIIVIREEVSTMPRRGENIYKRKDGRWEGRYIKSRSASGKAIYGYVYAHTYKEAKEKLAIRLSSQNESPAKTSNQILCEHFQTIAMDWFDSMKGKIKESTSNKYWNILNSYVLPAFGEKELQEITYDFVNEICNHLLINGGKNGQGLSPKTVSDILSLIRCVLHYASQQGKTLSCDAHSIHVKRHMKELRVLSISEQQKLCKYLKSDLSSYNVGILLCLFTGMRVGEVCALRWEDISIPDKTIHVHHTLQRIQNRNGNGAKTRIVITTPKSACSIRVIPIPDELIEILTIYQKATSGYILSNNEHQCVEPRIMQNHFKKALRESEVAPANYHALRHTFATRCIELGFDIKSLSEILGHASVNITMNRYVHPSLELKKENMRKLSSLLAVK